MERGSAAQVERACENTQIMTMEIRVLERLFICKMQIICYN